MLGCMDPAANDYNPLATVQDGSCHYSSGHWGVINQTLLVNRHHELELLLEEALSAGANRSAANASVGHCQCSGRTNNAGEGRDCSDIDAGGHWCYTEPGLCDDGERSGSVVDSEWSYLACYPEAESGNLSTTGNLSSTASGRTTVWAVDAATPEPSGLAWYRVAELILLGVFAAALGLGLLWHMSTVGGWLEKALMEVESHSQYVVGKSGEGLVLTIRATQDVVTVATTATPQDVAALGKAAGASVVGTPRTLKQMKQNVTMGWSRDSEGSAADADDAQSDALEAPSSPSNDESGSDGGSSPTSRSRSRSASPRGMQRVSVRGAGDAMNAGLSRAEKAVLSGQKLTSQAIGTGLEGGKGVLAARLSPLVAVITAIQNRTRTIQQARRARDLAKKHGPGILEGFSSFLAARRVFDDLQRYAGAPATQW